MMNKRILLFAAMALTMTACGPKAGKIFSEEWNTPYGTAPFSKITVADYKPAILAGIEAQKAEIRAIVENPDAPTFENTIAAYELSGDLLSKASGVFFNLSESDSTPEIQQIEELQRIDRLAEKPWSRQAEQCSKKHKNRHRNHQR